MHHLLNIYIQIYEILPKNKYTAVNNMKVFGGLSHINDMHESHHFPLQK